MAAKPQKTRPADAVEPAAAVAAAAAAAAVPQVVGDTSVIVYRQLCLFRFIAVFCSCQSLCVIVRVHPSITHVMEHRLRFFSHTV